MDHQPPQEQGVEHGLLETIDQLREMGEVGEDGGRLGEVGAGVGQAEPVVPQKTKSCSLAMSFTLPARPRRRR